MSSKLISIIIPCYNERLYIDRLLVNLIEQDYPKNLLEILIIDGISTDGTDLIIDNYCKQYSYIKLFKNYNKTVPYALNLGITNSSGDIIVRMDAHSAYPVNYISTLVENLVSLDADNVGGVWITKPGNDTVVAKAISYATSCSFGIGNARYRLTSDKIQQVDTVPYGCYRRDIFEKIGLFDEDLIRNQDDEFNVRLIQNGGKIFLIPDLKIEYFARESIRKAARMFYQYGLFKPLVMKKTKTILTLRQLAPVAFLLYSILLVPLLLLFPSISLLFLLPAFLYVLISMSFTVRGIVRLKDPRMVILPYVFAVIHYSYGIGYLTGLYRFLLMGKKPEKKRIRLSR